MKNKTMLFTALGLQMLCNSFSLAAELTIPNSFQSGQPARAAEVNQNFSAVEQAVDDNHARIIALETTNATLLSRIADLEAKLANVSLVTHYGQPTIRFEGVNVQIVNGQDATDTANGTGNLIVGYDEEDVSGTYRCTLGNNDAGTIPVSDEATCLSVNGSWTNLGFKAGSHYVVAGSQNNYSRWGGVVFGFRNTSNIDFANVTGGNNNIASGFYSNVNGGAGNIAIGHYSTVNGGNINAASGGFSSVSGGARNTASGIRSSISGGSNNSAIGNFSSICGGGNGTLAGGNVADTNFSSILGGINQNTSTASQTIPALP